MKRTIECKFTYAKLTENVRGINFDWLSLIKSAPLTIKVGLLAKAYDSHYAYNMYSWPLGDSLVLSSAIGVYVYIFILISWACEEWKWCVSTWEHLWFIQHSFNKRTDCSTNNKKDFMWNSAGNFSVWFFFYHISNEMICTLDNTSGEREKKAKIVWAP